MDLRERLQRLDGQYFDIFVDLTTRITPLLTSIEQQFPEYTRHDPSHNQRLEVIADDLLRSELKDALSAADLFVLLCSLWIHDSGMGIYTSLESPEQGKAEFVEKLARYERLGRSRGECWRDYVREHHHELCIPIASDFLGDRTSAFLVHWIGMLGASHGEREIHNRQKWPKRAAISASEAIHPPLLAVVLRLADILHFSADRAPDYMLEHRRIENLVSVSHWRAHQVAAGYSIDDDICRFDGVTHDDEAYWFAQQFFDAMESELKYCRSDVLPGLDPPFDMPLSFAQIDRSIAPRGFVPGRSALTVRVDAPKLLGDLLNDALYAGKPAWFRELLQNAFDACRDLTVRHSDSSPSVKIIARTEPDQIVFEDTGIGMRRSTVEQFMLVAGASYWSSDEYRAEAVPLAGHVGRFGIGFMSVFAVAEEVAIETRHVGEEKGSRFLIRSARRVIRVEECDRIPSGTKITIQLRHGTLSTHDVAELLADVCPYPEFPLSLSIDGLVECDQRTGVVPSLSDDGFELRATGHVMAAHALVAREIREDGISGVFQMPKLSLRSLGASVPDMRGWLRRAGWHVAGVSKIYYGGIAYPSLHALSSPGVFTHIPSIGYLRVAVSPNRYPLEMNLARDSFASGDGTLALFRAVSRIMDGFLADDLEQELEAHLEPTRRSAIAGFYSWTLLHLWTGHIPSISSMALSPPPSAVNAPAATPWPRLTSLMERTLTLRTFDRSGTVRRETVAALVDSNALLFAGGSMGRGIPEPLQRAVFAYSAEAKILFGIPDIDFGIMHLRHWAKEEILVPVTEHGRSAFGIRLARSARPYPLYPRETEMLGLPIASGPEEYALIDYRDMMAEIGMRPTGAPTIVAALNRRNPKIARLLNRLDAFADANSLRRELRELFKTWRKSFVIGDANRYSKTVATLVAVTNSVAATLGVSIDPIKSDAIPAYMSDGEVIPFGRPSLDELTAGAYGEAGNFDMGAGELS